MLSLAQYTTTTTTTTSSSGIGMVFIIIYIALIVVLVASLWKIFTKAGKPGWAAIVPIYNIIVLLQIISRPLWWIILYLIPVVGIIVGIINVVDLAKVFGKSTGFALLMIFLPFIGYPMLGFGDAKYQGGQPSGATGTPQAPPAAPANPAPSAPAA